MSARSRDNSVSFFEELPIPSANLSIYQEVYVLEQWLRRIAYAALLGRHGRSWQGTLDTALLKDLRKRLRQLEGRVHLDCENSENSVWLLTLDELREVLLADSIWPAVKQLTRLPRRVVESKVEEIRELRNVVSHSRAVGPQGELLARAAAAVLQVGIDNFKNQLLYNASREKIHLGEPADYPTGSLPARFAERTRGCDWSKFQPMLSESKYFFSMTRLPVEPFNLYVGVRGLLTRLEAIHNDLLAVMVNKLGDEFTLVWPKGSGSNAEERILDFFFANHNQVWVEVPYEEQGASAICDPAIWFYENELPERL